MLALCNAAIMLIFRGDLPSRLAEEFNRVPRVAWDVETTGLDWRRDRLGTCQLFAENVGVAIVAMESDRPHRLAALLEEPGIEKVFHHAPFDLRFMVRAWNSWPTSVRCTKVASRLLAPESPNKAHSLQELVYRHLGVSLKKGLVRTSDWSGAELTAEQIEYATRDVLYLLPLLDVLQESLNSRGMARLYESCCAFLPACAALEINGYSDVFAY